MAPARRLGYDSRGCEVIDDRTPADLEEQRRYYEALIRVSPTAIVTCDADLRITSWNPAANQLFGYTAEEALGRNIDDLVANSVEVREEAAMLDRTVTTSPLQRFTRRTRKDGSLVDVSLRAAAIVVGGKQVGIYAFYDDVSELVRQRRYLESLVEISPVAVLTLDRNAIVTSWNPAAQRLFGYTAEEAVGTNVDDLVANDSEIREEALRYTREAWGKPGFREMVRRTRKDGSLIDVEVSTSSVMHEGEPIAYYVIYHDISELQAARRRLEQRVAEQMAELVRTGELARFLPRQVAEGLLAGRVDPQLGSERRRITVLFADMVGFTHLSETLEPEELSEVLNEYLRDMSSAVVEFGGTLDSFIGDGIMAVFGAPHRMADAEQAWSAARTADEMRRRSRELAARLRERGIPTDLEIRIGINTGHCTVGVFGSDLMRAYKAVGFAVNVAQRLQEAAAPGSILCGFRTYALLKDRVRAVERQPLMVKGSSRPVEAWEIVDLSGSH